MDGKRWRRRIERLLWGVGGALTLAALAGHALQLGLSRWDAAAFESERQAVRVAAAAAGPVGSPAAAPAPERAAADGAPPDRLAAPERPDTSEWSPSRIARYAHALLDPPGERLARLEIPRVDLSVTVLDGTDAWSLNRGVGRIAGTARPGEAGNVGIAGHRDGFFRALRHLEPGDALRLTTLDGVRRYTVTWTRVVDPEDVWVLERTDEPSLTLVTCYPFYYVGSAPHRYVVRARAEPPEAARVVSD